MSGIQDTPLRIPAQWDAKWFDRFIREVLAKADARNATGTGITISGSPDTTADLEVSLDAGSVTFTTMQDISNNSILGRVSAGTGSVEELTGANVRTITGLATTDNVQFAKVNAGTNGYEVSGTKVVGAQGSAIASLTNSSGGTASGDLVSIGNTSTSNEGSKINDNFTELNVKLDAVLSALRTHGLIDT